MENIFWITSESAKMPCNQRVKIIGVNSIDRVNPTLRVKLLGTDEIIKINSSDIVGVDIEISDKFIVKFNYKSCTIKG